MHASQIPVGDGVSRPHREHAIAMTFTIGGFPAGARANLVVG
ncbi:MAG TPA: hypothetical protein VE669_08685 [Actinomycetota bacterium]|nr:hypothetical protein [Actinomycetota bacterium]